MIFSLVNHFENAVFVSEPWNWILERVSHLESQEEVSHFMRQKNFEGNLFDIRNHFRDSKTKPADASNFLGPRKISLVQNECIDLEL